MEIEGDPLILSGTKITIDGRCNNSYSLNAVFNYFILGIIRTQAYPACPNEKCKFRRVQPLDTTPDFVKCENCKATFANENLCETGFIFVVTIQLPVASNENKYTIFTDGVKMLLDLPKDIPFGTINSFQLEDKFFEKLPLNFTGKIRVGDNSIIDVLAIT